MAIQQRNNEDEESCEIKKEGHPTEEFKVGIKEADVIKEEWEPNKEIELGRPGEERKPRVRWSGKGLHFWRWISC